MARLILTSEHSGAGHLKSSHIADEVCILSQRLVCGPVPAIVNGIAVSEATGRMAEELGNSYIRQARQLTETLPRPTR